MIISLAFKKRILAGLSTIALSLPIGSAQSGSVRTLFFIDSDSAKEDILSISPVGSGNTPAVAVNDVGGQFANVLVVDSVNERLFWYENSSNTIFRSDLDGLNRVTLATIANDVPDMVYDSDNDELFFIDRVPFTSATIQKVSASGTNETPSEVVSFTNAGGKFVNELAIDSAGGNLFWYENETNAIYRSDLSGGNIATLASVANDVPDIEYDPSGNELYFIDRVPFTSATIQKVSASGVNQTPSVVVASANTGGKFVNKIAVDVASSEIFWWENESDVIYRSDLSGSSRVNLANLTSSAQVNDLALLIPDPVVADVEVVSLDLVGSSPSNAASAEWEVTFDGPVAGLSASNFDLVATGVSGASINSVTAQGGAAPQAVWRIAVNTGNDSGTLRLDLDDDSGMAPAVSNETFTGQVLTVDKAAPVISGAKDIVVSVPASGTATVTYTGVSATDNIDGAVPLTCTPPSGSSFPIGVNPVSCTATDTSGNVGVATFNVIVLEIATTPGGRFVDAVSVRGDTPTGSPGAVLDVKRAYLNNNDEVIFSASLSGGTGSGIVARGPLVGTHTAIAVDGTASGVGNFGNFEDLTLNDSGNAGFASLVDPSNQGHFVNSSGGAGNTTNSVVKGGTAPTGGGETYRSLQKPALASNGELLTRANLNTGSGAGVTAGDDTLVVSSSGTVIAREGGVTSIGGGLLYSGLSNRIVASENNDRYAFSAFLKPSSSLANTGLFSDVLGAGDPALIVREGDSADGITGAEFSNFLGEAVNSAGAVAFRSNARGGGVTSDDNEGIWTNSGNTSAPPVLVAREGDAVPCLPAPFDGLVAFDRFTTLALGDDGSVCFFAYLKDATATPAVNSTNDGSIWRWDGSMLHLIAREGDLANNTDGATIGRLTTFACSGAGGVVYQVEYTSGQGDYTATNRDAIYLDRGAVDAVPELVLRRGDSFDYMGNSHTVSGVEISTEENTGGGTGGYGRAINDDGDILLNLSLSGNLSGIFVLSPAPAP